MTMEAILMAYEQVREYFEQAGLADRVLRFEDASDTVEHAAQVIECEPAMIAKTLSFLVDGEPILVVMAGDMKADNRKFKQVFGTRPRMIKYDEVEAYVGHAPGGVCPFAVKPAVKTYLDTSLQRFTDVYPAAGDGNSAVYLTLEELETHSHSQGWVDVAK